MVIYVEGGGCKNNSTTITHTCNFILSRGSTISAKGGEGRVCGGERGYDMYVCVFSSVCGYGDQLRPQTCHVIHVYQYAAVLLMLC